MLVEFKSGSCPLKNMAANGRGSFPYLALEKPCKHSGSHNFCSIIMKVNQNIGFIDMSDEFENGRDQWKNMAAMEWGSFLYMYVRSIFLKYIKKIHLGIKNMAARVGGVIFYIGLL